MKLGNRQRLLIRVCGTVSVVILAKLVVHGLGWEIISVNPLFSGIVAANIFLMGFMLSGVMSDYKESERLPGDLGASLQNLSQEIVALSLAKPGIDVAPCLWTVSGLADDLLAWFHKKRRTGEVLDRLDALTPHFAAMEESAQATMVARLKQEQGNLRRTLIRIRTIRETSFVSAGYLLADMTTILLCVGLVLARIEPFYESLFFVCVISWLMVFLLMLIRDLDNPFGYYEKYSGTDVSLEPLVSAAERLAVVLSAAEEAAPACRTT